MKKKTDMILILLFFCCSAIGQIFPSEPGLTVIPAKDTIIVYGQKILEWNDYRGKPLPENISSDRVAATTTTISNECICKDSSMKYYVSALFSKPQSWVLENGRTAAMLQHERLHFDITELYARKARKMYDEFYSEMKNGNRTCAEIRDVRNRTEMMRISSIEENTLYDKESNHGTNMAKQSEWEQNVKKRLKELEKYK